MITFLYYFISIFGKNILEKKHIPVLVHEVVEVFKDLKSGTLIDCTLGFGGHSSAILESNKNINIFACDRDDSAIEYCKKKFENKNIQIQKSNFSQIIEKSDQKNVSGILADIGVSSVQLDLNERGFSINSDFLDMRMDKSAKISAKEVVNEYSHEQLATILKEFGEINNSNQIAQKIIKARNQKEITSAKELTDIIGYQKIKGRSVSQTILVFQAIRIEVNKELLELNKLLKSIENSEINNAILAIISFHSLEDRIVKNTFKTWEKSCICPQLALKCVCGNNHSLGKILTSKPIVPSSNEIKMNSRSSCAKMRVFKIERTS